MSEESIMYLVKEPGKPWTIYSEDCDGLDIENLGCAADIDTGDGGRLEFYTDFEGAWNGRTPNVYCNYPLGDGTKVAYGPVFGERYIPIAKHHTIKPNVDYLWEENAQVSVTAEDLIMAKSLFKDALPDFYYYEKGKQWRKRNDC